MDVDGWCVNESESFDYSKEIYICDEFRKYSLKIDDFSNSLRQLDCNIEFKVCTRSCNFG